MEKNYKKIVTYLGICMTLVFAMVFTGCGKKEIVDDTEAIGTEVIGTEEIDTEEVATEETEEIGTETTQESVDVPKNETTTDNSTIVTDNNTPVSDNPTGSTSDSNTASDTAAPEVPQTPEVPQAPESSETGFKTGTYRGGHKIEAMGGELPYTYSMNFKDDGTYLYQVSFVVGGETYSEEESGTYTVSGSSITMTSSDGVTTSGSYSDGKVTITRRVSTFASEDATITLQ